MKRVRTCARATTGGMVEAVARRMRLIVLTCRSTLRNMRVMALGMLRNPPKACVATRHEGERR
jgi:hypothetical protein